jgi:hypothetical protein
MMEHPCPLYTQTHSLLTEALTATVKTIHPCAIMNQDKSRVYHYGMLHAGSVLPIARSIVTDAVGARIS